MSFQVFEFEILTLISDVQLAQREFCTQMEKYPSSLTAFISLSFWDKLDGVGYKILEHIQIAPKKKS